MGKLKREIEKYIQRMIDRATNTGLMQDETTAEGEKYVTPGISELLREAGAEGCVLLKNDGALPLAKDQEIALFGRCQLDRFFVGYGSGGSG
jgi:beta-glucosidase-like glycosyl hydrolase